MHSCLSSCNCWHGKALASEPFCKDCCVLQESGEAAWGMTETAFRCSSSAACWRVTASGFQFRRIGDSSFCRCAALDASACCLAEHFASACTCCCTDSLSFRSSKRRACSRDCALELSLSRCRSSGPSRFAVSASSRLAISKILLSASSSIPIACCPVLACDSTCVCLLLSSCSCKS